MAWVDCMRLRRVATVVRGVGWTVSAVIFSCAAVLTFVTENEHGLTIFVALAAVAIVVLAVSHGIAWAFDRRGERIVTR
jgi:peptidoglycan/LPS O-acetylase OafA/YrhL